MNNFYLYRFEKSTRFQLLPWDRNSALYDADLSVFNRVERNLLMKRLMEYDDFRRIYEDALRRSADVAMHGRHRAGCLSSIREFGTTPRDKSRSRRGHACAPRSRPHRGRRAVITGMNSQTYKTVRPVDADLSAVGATHYFPLPGVVRVQRLVGDTLAGAVIGRWTVNVDPPPGPGLAA